MERDTMQKSYNCSYVSVPAYSEDELGEDLPVWQERLWDELEEQGYHFFRPYGARHNSHENRLHLPSEFPDEEPEYDAYDVVDSGTLCGRAHAPKWRAKPVDAYPVGYNPVCGYCWYGFVEWWQNERDHDD